MAERPDLNRDAAARARAIASEIFEEEKKPEPKLENRPTGTMGDAYKTLREQAARAKTESEYDEWARKVSEQAQRAAVVAQARLNLAKDPVWNPSGAPPVFTDTQINNEASRGFLIAPPPLDGRVPGILIDDIEYPDMAALFRTLRAIVGESVHGRHLVEAAAARAGVTLGKWLGEKWGKTIDPSWRRE